MSGNLVVVGSLNTDLMVKVDHMPQVGETVKGDFYMETPGGKGANQACAASRCGGAVTLIGKVGNDGRADRLLTSLRNSGVNVDHVARTDDAATGMAIIEVDSEANNRIAVVPGANAMLLPENIVQYESVIAAARLVLLQLEIPLATVAKTIEISRKHGVQILIDPSPTNDISSLSKLIAFADYISPNKIELSQILDAEFQSAEDVARGAALLRKDRVGKVIVRCGVDGTIVVDGDASYQVPAFSVDAIDTSGAGDAFIGAFAAGLTSGRQFRNSIELATAAAALTVTRYGTQSAMPEIAEVLEFMEARK